ncbi:MAG: hypothetical protein ACXACF_06965 [Candidatus Hermodarchaeia archaeon]
MSQAEIAALPYEPSIRNTLLKAKLEIDRKKREIERLESQRDEKQSDAVLDPETAKAVARFLTRRFDPSRTSTTGGKAKQRQLPEKK